MYVNVQTSKYLEKLPKKKRAVGEGVKIPSLFTLYTSRCLYFYKET